MIRRWMRALQLDRTLSMALLGRLWQLGSGPITVLLVARHMPPTVQGFYYTFASLMGLQSFMELGFYLVIINVASHEWAHLHLEADGRIGGDPVAKARLVSLGRLIFRWYGIGTLAFMALVGGLGFHLFGQSAHPEVPWQAPWVAILLLQGMLFWGLGFNALLEGCNQVRAIHTLRFQQALLSSLAFWTVLMLGGGLWAAVASALVMLGRDLYLVLVRYRGFFQTFWAPSPEGALSWRREVWPMQ